MACNNVILAQPETGTSINYDLPAGDSAQLSFGPGDLDGVRLNDVGGLVLSFVDGGELTITNFQSIVDDGNLLYLSDGTLIDPAALQAGLMGSIETASGGDEAGGIMIGVPADSVAREITLEPGQTYVFDFDLSDAQSAQVENGQLVIKFPNEGTIVLNNFEETANGDLPPVLGLTSEENIISAEELITSIELAQTAPAEEELEEVEEKTETRSEIQAADLNSGDDTGALGETGLAYGADAPSEDVADIEPASGDDLAQVAQQLANIETAAGDTGAAGGRGGFGFGSSVTGAPFDAPGDVGPINPTLLQYQAPDVSPERLDIEDPAIVAFDDSPTAVGPFGSELDETDMDGNPLPVTGQVIVDFGADGPGVIAPNGGVTVSGSLPNGQLTTGGNSIVVNTTAFGNNLGYIGTSNGQTVFTLEIDRNTGDYTYTQILPFDHADSNDPNDMIRIQFGVSATDSDGDAIQTQITIDVFDDAPVASDPAEETVDESNLGPIVESGSIPVDFGEDGPGEVRANDMFTPSGSLASGNLTSGGQPITVGLVGDTYTGTTPNGDVIFTLEVQQNGDYLYRQFRPLDHADPNDPNDIITLEFGAIVTDSDGDTDTATITINVADDAPTLFPPNNGQPGGPTVGNGLETVDESNLPGSNTVSGSLNPNFGTDAPGTITPNNGFFSSGSLPGGNLTSGGEPVTVTLVDNTYVGEADGETIFTLEIDPDTGDYTFTQLGPLDHADGNDPDDVITLEFGVDAEDSDGDTDSGVITINVRDDAPPAVAGAVENIDETNLGPIVETGSLPIDFGNDGPGEVTPDSTFTPSGSLAGGNLTSGGVPVVVTQTPTGYVGVANGVTVFELTVDPTNGDYEFTLFENLDHADNSDPNDIITLEFGFDVTDFDGDTVSTEIVINVADDAPTFQPNGPEPDSGLETIDETDLENGSIVETGSLNADFGGDAPGTYAFTTNGFTSGGSQTGGNLSHNGVPVMVSLVGNTYTGTAGGVTVFTLELDPSTGDYTFELLEQLDHADGNDDNDSIELTFDVAAVDSEGDRVTGEITINVLDDSVEANNDFNTFDTTNGSTTGNVITGQNGGPNAADETSEDVPNEVVEVSFGNTTVTIPAGGSNSIDGDFGTLTINSDGSYTYELFPGVNVGTGDTSSFSANPGDVSGTQTSITEDGITITSQNGGDLTYVDQGEGNGIGIAQRPGTDKVFGAEEILNLTFDQNVATAAITIGDVGDNNIGREFTYNVYLASDPSTPIEQTVTLDGSQVNDGLFTFNIDASDFGPDAEIVQIDLVGGPSFILNEVDVTHPGVECTEDEFEYTLRDGDGDTDTATLNLKGKDLTDNVPVIAEPITETVDETDLGPVVETGTISVNYNGEGPGAVTPNNTFNPTGSLPGGNLTSGGVPVVVTLVGNTYVGTAGGTEVFTLEIETDGDYTFTLKEPLDHADGNDDNDVITLEFGVTATDADGDTDTATITINVADDAPEAEDDSDTAGESETITGNVTNNDDDGEDAPATVTNVNFNGTDFPIPAGGSETITGQYGTLTINSDGSYSYTANSNNPDGTDSFVYTLTDFDGDSDTATLDIRVNPDDDVPQVVNPDVEVVDETDFGTVLSETGTVTANFGSDAPGSFGPQTGAGNFASSTTLTSGGVAVVVALAGNTYTGTANGTTVFTLTVNSNGSYSYQQFANLDHPNSNDPDDSIRLEFGFTATDSDGDSANGIITVDVKDDGPDARNDNTNVDEAVGTASGNVVSNDDLSTDETNTVTDVTFNGTTVTVPATGNATIDGQYGTLSINAQGQYTYTLTATNPPAVAENFTYTLRDGDGDTDTARLRLNLEIVDNQPVVTPEEKDVDESDLPDSTTVTGKVNVDFGSDGPGTIELKDASTFDSSVPLTSGGTPVTITLSGNTYTGTAGGQTIFTMQVQTDGSYTFTQFGPLDHPDATDPNDVIELKFCVSATDSDGDSTDGLITINVIDDAPVANDDTDSAGEGETITGSVSPNDDSGNDVPAKVVCVTFNGQDFDVPANGTVTVVGDYGTLKIAADGSYSYTANSNNPDGTDSFTYKLEDFDGDQDTATLDIRVTPDDDIPQVVNPGAKTVDESDFGTVLQKNGTVTADFGSDGPGSFMPTNAGSFSAGGSVDTGTLRSNGAPVNVTLAGNTYTGTAGGTTIFTLTINSDGSYSYRQFEPMDHADPNNPDDVITLNFGFKATDSDGDTGTGNIRIRVKDDAPEADNDFNNFNGNSTNGNVITGQNGGAGADDDLSADDANVIKMICFGNKEVDVPSSGTVSIDGDHGRLTIAADGSYTYTLFDGAGGGQTGQSFDFNPTSSLVAGNSNSVTRDGVTVSGPADLIWRTHDIEGSPGIGVAGGQSNTSKIFGETIDIRFADGVQDVSIKASDIGPNNFNKTFTFKATFEDGSTATIQRSTGTPSNGNKTFNFDNDDFGTNSLITKIEVKTNTSWLLADITGTTPDIPPSQVTDRFEYKLVDGDGDSDTATLTLRGTPTATPAPDDQPDARNDNETLTGNQTMVTGDALDNDDLSNDGGNRIDRIEGQFISNGGSRTVQGTYGTLEIDSDGSYKYTLTDPNAPQGARDDFVYRLRDADGDNDTARIRINLDIDPPPAPDDQPDARNDNDTLTGTQTMVTGDALDNDDLSNDGGNRIDQIDGQSISNGGSRTVQGTYGTLEIDSDGSYKYTLTDPNAPQGARDDFTYRLRDADGDRDTARIRINLDIDPPPAPDDQPIANNDKHTFNSTTTGGDVITGLHGGNGSADYLSQDGGNRISKISFGGNTVSIPNGGSRSIDGDHGTLTINSDGSYIYRLNSNSVGGSDSTVRFTPSSSDVNGNSDIRISSGSAGSLVYRSHDILGNPGIGISGGPANTSKIFGEEIRIDYTDAVESGSISVSDIESNDHGLALKITAFFEDGSRSSRNFETGSPASGNKTLNFDNGDFGSNKLISEIRVEGVVSNQGSQTQVFDLNPSSSFVRGNSHTVSNGGITVSGPGNLILRSHDIVGKKGIGVAGGPSNTSKIFGEKIDIRFAEGVDEVRIEASDFESHDFNSTFSFKATFADGSTATIHRNTGTSSDGNEVFRFKNSDFGKSSLITKINVDSDASWLLVDVTAETPSGGSDQLSWLLSNVTGVVPGDPEIVTDKFTYTLRDADGDKDTATLTLKFDPTGQGPYNSPLVLDLDGDGVELVSVFNGVAFDINADGTTDQTGWAGSDDGLLAIDLDGDGRINDGSELFGNNIEDGFSVLSNYDSNSDGVIDAKDERFADLQVWQDANQNGQSQQDEMSGLDKLGITSINLAADEVAELDNGNIITHRSTFEYADGSEAEVVDAWFEFKPGEAIDSGAVLFDAQGHEDDFLFQAIAEGVDTVKDFDALDGEEIDLSQLIESHDELKDAIDDFIFNKVIECGGCIEVSDVREVSTDNLQGPAISDLAQEIVPVSDQGSII